MTKRNLISILLIIISCFLLLSGAIVYLKYENFNPDSLIFFCLSGAFLIAGFCVLLIKNNDK